MSGGRLFFFSYKFTQHTERRTGLNGTFVQIGINNTRTLAAHCRNNSDLSARGENCCCCWAARIISVVLRYAEGIVQKYTSAYSNYALQIVQDSYTFCALAPRWFMTAGVKGVAQNRRKRSWLVGWSVASPCDMQVNHKFTAKHPHLNTVIGLDKI